MQVVLVAQIGARVEVATVAEFARVAAKDEHAVLVDDRCVVVAGRGRRAVQGAAPRVVVTVVGDQVVEHVASVIAAEDVQRVFVRAHRVFGSPSRKGER